MDIPQIEFVEAVTGEPILSQPLADGRLHEDGPDLDDLCQEVCEECNEVKPKGTACPCLDCETCGGDGAVRRSNGRTTDRYSCDDCNGTGRAGG